MWSVVSYLTFREASVSSFSSSAITLPSVSSYLTTTLPFTSLYTYVTSTVSPATTLPVSFPIVEAGTNSYTFPSAVLIRFGFIPLSDVLYSVPGLPSVVSLLVSGTLFPSGSVPDIGLPS